MAAATRHLVPVGTPEAGDVLGDVKDSKIHHNHYGVYTFGLQGGQWTGNEVYSNDGYGFDAHDHSDDLVIEGNDVHDNGLVDAKGRHGIILSETLAGLLEVGVGDRIGVELLEGDRRSFDIPVSGLSLGYLGLSATTSLEAQSSILSNSINNLEKVDTNETATRITTLETQLELAYTLTGRLQNMSLVNYL